MSTLALNAGSTSLKFGLFEDDDSEPLLSGELDWAHGDRERATQVLHARNSLPVRVAQPVVDDGAAAACAIRSARNCVSSTPGATAIAAVGHRVVHGGDQFSQSVAIDARVKAAVFRWSELAPLHNPAALRVIEAAEAALPGVPQVAVFDTSFYAKLPAKARVYPLPYACCVMAL